MKDFESGWPESFHQTISTQVVTMSATRKQAENVPTGHLDTGLIFARAMTLTQSCDIDVKNLFEYELAPIPTVMFEEKDGLPVLKIAKSKSTMKKKLQVEVAFCVSDKSDGVILDGCAILWVIHWPSDGTVRDFVDGFNQYVVKMATCSHLNLIFDRYKNCSIKSKTRSSRAGAASREYQLSLDMPMPPQSVMLTGTQNKEQLIEFIVSELTKKVQGYKHPTSLIITGKSPVPVEIKGGSTVMRQDLQTTHEEADVIIPQQVLHLVGCRCSCIQVVCDDMDVFALLLYFHQAKDVSTTVLMEGTSPQRAVINIGDTVNKHQNIVSNILHAYALTGCDTVGSYHGIGKTTVIKVLQSGFQFESVGDPAADIGMVVKEATRFIAACYNVPINPEDTMTDVRYRVWVSKTGRKGARVQPKLKSLPPTSEAFAENVKRTQLQASIWMAALDPDPPAMEPCEYGRLKDEHFKALQPLMFPSETQIAPSDVLKMIQCSCAGDQLCSTMRCSCQSSPLGCSPFCKCGGEENCCNSHTDPG